MRISDWSSDVCSSDLPDIYEEFDRERLPAKDEAKDKLPPSCRGLVYHTDLIQGSEEWLQARCGLLTASEMKLIVRSEEHTSELQSLMRISYAVFCLKKKTNSITTENKTLIEKQ